MEIRRYSLSEAMAWLPQQSDGRGLRAVGRVESLRLMGEKTPTDYRYYLGSFPDLTRFADATRGHGGIENGQHWVLDVQFGEDAHRARKDHSAKNLALVRRMAINVIRHNGPSKDSVRLRKLRASLNDDYRFQLISGKL